MKKFIVRAGIRRKKYQTEKDALLYVLLIINAALSDDPGCTKVYKHKVNVADKNDNT